MSDPEEAALCWFCPVCQMVAFLPEAEDGECAQVPTHPECPLMDKKPDPPKVLPQIARAMEQDRQVRERLGTQRMKDTGADLPTQKVRKRLRAHRLNILGRDR